MSSEGLSSSSSSYDISLELSSTTANEEEVIKFKVPSTPSLDVSVIVPILERYQPYVNHIQLVWLWKRPMLSLINLILVNLVFLFVYLLDYGFLSTLVLLIILIQVILMLHSRYSNVFADKFFQLTAEDVEGDYRLFTNTEIANLVSIFGSRLHCFFQGIMLRARDNSVVGSFVFIGIIFFIGLFSTLATTFWLVFCICNFILVVPGLALHPEVRPRIQTYLDWLMMLVAPKIKDE